MKKTLLALIISGSILLTACEDKNQQALQQELNQSQQTVAQLQNEIEQLQTKLSELKQKFPSLQTENQIIFKQSTSVKQNPTDLEKGEEPRTIEIDVFTNIIKTNIAWIDEVLLKGTLTDIVDITKKEKEERDPLASITNGLQSIFDQFVSEAKEESGIGYSFHIYNNYHGQRNNILTFSRLFDIYTGGAHGTYQTQYLIFDSNKQKQIQVSDLFNQENLKKAAEILWQRYVQDNGGNESELFSDKANFIQNLNNFYFSESGIEFIFPLYSIGPYSEGEPVRTLYWNEANPLIAPEYKNNDIANIEN